MNDPLQKIKDELFKICNNKFLCGKILIQKGFDEKDIIIEVSGEGYMSFSNDVINELSLMCNKIHYVLETESSGCEHCERKANIVLTIVLEDFKYGKSL